MSNSNLSTLEPSQAPVAAQAAPARPIDDVVTKPMTAVQPAPSDLAAPPRDVVAQLHDAEQAVVAAVRQMTSAASDAASAAVADAAQLAQDAAQAVQAAIAEGAASLEHAERSVASSLGIAEAAPSSSKP